MNRKAEQERRIPLSKEANGTFLSRCPCFILQRASLVISRRLDAALRPVGLTSRQLVVRGAIAEQDTLRHAALAEVLGKDQTTVTANLGPWKRRRLVVTAVDRDDCRARTIALTPDGGRLLHKARGLLSRFNAVLCDRIRNEGSMRDLRAAPETVSQQSAHGWIAHRAV